MDNPELQEGFERELPFEEAVTMAMRTYGLPDRVAAAFYVAIARGDITSDIIRDVPSEKALKSDIIINRVGTPPTGKGRDGKSSH